jgi:hypothetical protein
LIVAGPPPLTETHDQVEVPLCVRAASTVGLTATGQLLGGQMADRLEEPEPGLVDVADRDEERPRNEAVDDVDDVVGKDRLAGRHGPHRIQRERAGEDRQPVEDGPLRFAEQVVGPLERGAQRPVALGAHTPAARQQPEHVVETLGDLGRAQRSRPRRGELDGQRNAVETSTDANDGIHVAVGVERRAGLLRSHSEERDRCTVSVRRQ